MRTTIDRAGRLVIPRGLRGQVGLRDGGEVDVAIRGASIVIEPVTGQDLGQEGPFVVIPASGQVMDDDAVRESRLGDQR
ncbi:MAG TPA: AbrB/MazE/SpoVT family DNA-binding domain-containing protein [Candidatus Limnocylindrales bacterium]|nr:AbrB/MazE/SpoVT family DNA-binding domain-containing protein [Candidatus Limnocylindrales bacterium]